MLDTDECGAICDEVIQQCTTLDLQLESLLTEIDDHGEEFLFFRKSSIKRTSNVCQNENMPFSMRLSVLLLLDMKIIVIINQVYIRLLPRLFKLRIIHSTMCLNLHHQ